MSAVPQLRRCRGFSLVEVMVAVIIIAVGMLGIAKMQALALSDTGSAGTRSLVAIQAAGLAASMHANRDYWAADPPPITNIAISGNGATVNIDVSTLAATRTSCIGCTATQMAAYDVQSWALALGQVVPAAAVVITCNTGGTPPLSCTIQISYMENATGVNATTSASDQSSAPSSGPNLIQQPQYKLYVEP